MIESQYIFEFCDSYNKRILKQKKTLVRQAISISQFLK